MRTLTLLLTLLIILNHSKVVYSQNSSDIRRTYHWYFGNGAGLDFSSGTAVAITNSPMEAVEGCASISDTCGNLLFYTDGDTVWDRNNNVMPNGIGLMGCNSSTQSSLIIPQPENDSLYYIFLTDCGENLGAKGLRYSIININMNGGLGEVVQKNTLVYAPASEKLAATYHANNTDIWILSVNRYPPPGPWNDTTMQYVAYLLTESGINTSPVYSASKIIPPKFEDSYLRFSHKGNIIANAWHSSLYDTIEIGQFNNNLGVITDLIILNSENGNIRYEPYGLVFSTDDSKFYASFYDMTSDYPDWHSKIYQYDISTYDSALIASSKTLIHYTDSTNPDLPHYLGMQVGSDGRIYIANMNNTNDPLNWYPDTIAVIVDPNLSGVACNFVEKGIYIGGGSQAGLPNFVDSYFNGPWLPPCTTSIENLENLNNISCDIEVCPNPFNDYTVINIINVNILVNEKYSIKLYDLFGHIVLNTETYNSYYRIHKGDLKEGIYFLKIQSGNFIYTNKLIIN
ncbi:MAG: T9SS type A sorting domain-containing protein [Bacteroidales bacterium]|nr:T9SS type A sorting domain-containing protein [Bacteroidales bacterium]